jgi:hypothetical protein
MHLRVERVPTAVEDAVKYIIFLVDADTLFDVALGMYDFSLVLLIAQHTQKVQPTYAICPDNWRCITLILYVRTLENISLSCASSVLWKSITNDSVSMIILNDTKALCKISVLQVYQTNYTRTHD